MWKIKRCKKYSISVQIRNPKGSSEITLVQLSGWGTGVQGSIQVVCVVASHIMKTLKGIHNRGTSHHGHMEHSSMRSEWKSLSWQWTGAWTQYL